MWNYVTAYQLKVQNSHRFPQKIQIGVVRSKAPMERKLICVHANSVRYNYAPRTAI
jgi:hypothetical protein